VNVSILNKRMSLIFHGTVHIMLVSNTKYITIIIFITM